MGGRFDENWRFSNKKIEFGLPFYKNVSALRARPLSYHILNENDNFKKEQLMHVYKIVHGSDFNINDNFNFTKLFMHEMITN